MKTMKKIIKRTGRIGKVTRAVLIKTALVIPVLTTLVFGLPKGIPVHASESGGSSDSQSAGQSLYDALRSIYGDSSRTAGSSSSSAGSGTTPSSGSNANTNQNSGMIITTDDLMKSIDTEAKGPQVSEITLGELYHEDYRVYEETLNEDYTIFTNVRNGTITNRPVMIDIPKGVGYSMKKNGEDFSYEPEDLIEEEGSYVLSLCFPFQSRPCQGRNSASGYSTSGAFTALWRQRAQRKRKEWQPLERVKLQQALKKRTFLRT